jgi:modulator of FtsH protease
LDGWESFFVAEVGASAALAGLIFVALSLNLQRILSLGGLPDRALQAIVLLVSILLVASLMLFPQQPATVVGLEILAVALGTLIVGTLLGLRGLSKIDRQYRGVTLRNLALFEIAVIPAVIGGAIVLAGDFAGLYWLGAAICLSLAKAMNDAWIFLVEINR